MSKKKVSIKNHINYYFGDIIKIEDFDFDILWDEKLYENILIYNVSYNTLMVAKPLRFRFDKVDGFIRVYDGTRYLVVLGPEKYDSIYNRIRYLISQGSGITYVFFFIIMLKSNWFLWFFTSRKKHWLCML